MSHRADSAFASTPVPRLSDFTPTAANRLSIDYDAASTGFRSPAQLGFPLIDAHAHINGAKAAKIYLASAARYGVSCTYSMTWWDEVETVKAIAGDRVRFIAMPKLQQMKDEQHLPACGLIQQVNDFYNAGARMLKFWVAPRIIDFIDGLDPALAKLDAQPRIEAMDRAAELGMMFMTHVADPDTWFATTYADADKYGTKAAQYDALEAMLERYRGATWLGAHMGGWPEDLKFLSGMLDRHPNFHLDTSATKWMVRELSRHPRPELVAFLERYRDRILFGSDIVTSDQHLDDGGDHAMYQKASSVNEARDLYASRYWALRTMFETTYDGESPIADPDLAMVEPDLYDAMSAPPLVGRYLDDDLLRAIYFDNAERVLGEYYGPHPPLTSG